MIQKIENCFGRLENIVGKMRKCWLPAFSPSSTMFSIGDFFWVAISCDGVKKGWPYRTTPYAFDYKGGEGSYNAISQKKRRIIGRNLAPSIFCLFSRCDLSKDSSPLNSCLRPCNYLAESVETDQLAHICNLILPCFLSRYIINFDLRNPI